MGAGLPRRGRRVWRRWWRLRGPLVIKFVNYYIVIMGCGFKDGGSRRGMLVPVGCGGVGQLGLGLGVNFG
jgi:hypothetical protein